MTPMKQRIVLSTLLALLAGQAVASPTYQVMIFSKGLPASTPTTPGGAGTPPPPTPAPTPTPPAPVPKGYVTVSPSSLSFASLQAGSSSSATLTVTNTGPGPLVFSNIFVSTGTSDYASSNNCGNVAAGASCSINVTFTPSDGGTRPGVLGLSHDGQGAGSVSLYGIGQAPSASLSTPTFSPTGVGSSSTATSTLTNTGSGPLAVSGVSTTGADFAVASSTCGASLGAGASCTTTVRFTPSSAASADGSLTFATNAGAQTVTLGSTGIQGYAAVNPSSLTFSAQQSGTSSASKIVTVTNTGTDTLTFTGVGISTGASDFAQSNTCGEVPVGGTCAVAVSFTPSTGGARPGTLSFTHNGGGIANVSLTGTGQASTASLSAPAFNSTTMVGTTSTAAAVLTNTGIGALSITPPTVASVTGTGFTFVSTTCTLTLAPGATCSTSVRFSPTDVTARTGSLVIATGAGDQSAVLSATGTPSALTASVSSLSFAALPTQTQTKTVTLTNTSATSATVSSLVLGGSSSTKYTVSGCLSAIPAGGTCTADVTFAPGTGAAAAGQTATLTVNHNAMNGPQVIDLTGSSTYTGAAPSGPSGATLPTFSGQNATWASSADYGGFTIGNSFRTSGKFTVNVTGTAASLGAMQYAVQSTGSGYYAVNWPASNIVKAGVFTGGAANNAGISAPAFATGDYVNISIDYDTRSLTWRKCTASYTCTVVHTASNITTYPIRLYIWKGGPGAAALTLHTSGTATTMSGYHNGLPD